MPPRSSNSLASLPLCDTKPSTNFRFFLFLWPSRLKVTRKQDAIAASQGRQLTVSAAAPRPPPPASVWVRGTLLPSTLLQARRLLKKATTSSRNAKLRCGAVAGFARDRGQRGGAARPATTGKALLFALISSAALPDPRRRLQEWLECQIARACTIIEANEQRAFVNDSY